MSITDLDGSAGWTPAPGSVARHYWPLPVRWAWWLAHRPALVAVVALALVVVVELGPLVLARPRPGARRRAGGVVAGAPGQLPSDRRPGPGGPVALVLGLRGPVAHGDDALGPRGPVQRRRVRAADRAGSGGPLRRSGHRAHGRRPAARRLGQAPRRTGARVRCPVVPGVRAQPPARLHPARGRPTRPARPGRARPARPPGGGPRRGAGRPSGGRRALGRAARGDRTRSSPARRVPARARCCGR